MTEKEAEELSERIVDSLFRNGANQVATRLDLRQGPSTKSERSLGGWCRLAAVDQVLAVLQGWKDERSV